MPIFNIVAEEFVGRLIKSQKNQFRTQKLVIQHVKCIEVVKINIKYLNRKNSQAKFLLNISRI